MRFATAVNVILLGVATVVSALPIAQFTSSLDLESRDDYDAPDMFEREFDEPSLYRRIEYHVALHKSKVGTEDEHWAMHIHPQNSHKTAAWHIVDAASEKGKGGVLQTDHQKMTGYDKDRQGQHHMILGSFGNAAAAHAAAESIKGIHCSQPYPGQNCVDWTKNAVAKLHSEGHISNDKKAEFDAHYAKHAETVRAKTGTAANIAKGK
jgi:hypothetical protein